tara:strand:+ start:520 stop:807 length:288 start_codon:yes stop_codon:yes gene_type:complete
MTTIQEIKNNRTLNWLISKSEVTFEDKDCFMTSFRGELPCKMLKELTYFFRDNGAAVTGGCISVGRGSINLITSKWKGNRKVTFSTCLSNDYKTA